MRWREDEAVRHFADVARAAVSRGAQLVTMADDQDVVIVSAVEYQELRHGTGQDDPLCEADGPYLDELELPFRAVWRDSEFGGEA